MKYRLKGYFFMFFCIAESRLFRISYITFSGVIVSWQKIYSLFRVLFSIFTIIQLKPTGYENRTGSFSISKNKHFWVVGDALHNWIHRVQYRCRQLFQIMSKHKNIPIKNYYQRAKVFGYMVLIVAVSLAIIYLFEAFAE